jgi:hypothetical protein
MATPRLITVSGTCYGPDGALLTSGSITFTSSTLVADALGNQMIPHPISANVSPAGFVTLAVPCTDDPAWSPSGWTWTLTQAFPGFTVSYPVAIPYASPGAALSLGALVPAPGTAVALYVTAATYNAGIAALLPKIAPEIVDTTFTVRKSDNTAGMRYRSTGSAVDIEKGSGDVIESTWSGALPGNGAQTNLRRLRGDGNTLVGRTEFGSGAFAAEQIIDSSAAGPYAQLGGGAGMGKMRHWGRKATAGAPTTGTWVTGDSIMDSANAWHYCTAGGTPGTWT